jgi:hypothetical protein
LLLVLLGMIIIRPVMHSKVGGGGWPEVSKVDTPSKVFTKLVDKTPKRFTLPQKLSQPLYTLPTKIWQKPYGPSPWIFKPCASSKEVNIYYNQLQLLSPRCNQQWLALFEKWKNNKNIIEIPLAWFFNVWLVIVF